MAVLILFIHLIVNNHWEEHPKGNISFFYGFNEGLLLISSSISFIHLVIYVFQYGWFKSDSNSSKLFYGEEYTRWTFNSFYCLLVWLLERAFKAFKMIQRRIQKPHICYVFYNQQGINEAIQYRKLKVFYFWFL